MSNAKPMSAERRADNYQAQTGLGLTPPQQRRTRKKSNRLLALEQRP